jgi:hypothetical protein
MKLPNGDRAKIDVQRKLVGYCLNKLHPTGRQKARVFESVLGIVPENADILVDALRFAAREGDAKIKDRATIATKYEIEFALTGPRGVAKVRSGWIIEKGAHVPRLTTCFVRVSSKGEWRGQRA